MASSPKKESKKRRRDERPKTPKRLSEEKEQEFADCLKFIFDFRIVTQKQIELFFDLKRSTAQRLLRLLYEHHYVNRKFVQFNEHTVYTSPKTVMYTIGKSGRKVLQNEFSITNFRSVPTNPSELFMKHARGINDVSIAIHLACKAQGWNVIDWIDERGHKNNVDYVKARTGKRDKNNRLIIEQLPIEPDSYYVIERPGKGYTPLFLEYHRRGNTKDFKKKIYGYVEYYKSGAFEKRYGYPGFRVLTVIEHKNESRKLEFLTKATAEVEGIGKRFWFTPRSLVEPDSILTGDVWQVAQPNNDKLITAIYKD